LRLIYAPNAAGPIRQLLANAGASVDRLPKGMAIFEAMSGRRQGQGNRLIEEPALAVPDDHAELVKADQRFQAALQVAIATGHERIEAVEATVQLKPRRMKLPR